MSQGSIQQNIEAVSNSVGATVAVPLVGFLWSWVRRLAPLFFKVLLVIAVVLSVYAIYAQRRDRQLKVFIGPVGTTAMNEASNMEQEFRRQKSMMLGPNYFVTEVAAGGALANLINVNRDQEGNVLGFATEGLDLDDHANIRTLAPLQWSYLHFIYRVDSLKYLLPHAAEATADHYAPVKLQEWARAYRVAHAKNGENELHGSWPQRVYLGPRDSGTKQIAKKILEQLAIPFSQIEATGVSDYDEMVLALKHGRIDGAFFTGPLYADPIREIAADHDSNCSLITFEPRDLERLNSTNSHIQSGTIRSHVYPFEVSRKDGVSRLDDVNTPAFRRVLVTSSFMNDADAKYIALYARSALGDDVTRPDKEGFYAGPDRDSKHSDLNYEPHNGVQGLGDNGPGINWFDWHAPWIVSLFLAMIVSVMADLAHRVSQWLDQNKAEANASDEESAADSDPLFAKAEDLFSRIDGLAGEIHEAGDRVLSGGDAVSEDQFKAWQKQFVELRRQVSDALNNKLINRIDKGHLDERLSALRSDLFELRNPSWRESPSPVPATNADGRVAATSSAEQV